MRKRRLYIGIDSGTQGTKAVVLNADSGEILAEAYSGHDLMEDKAGKREQDPAWWIEACGNVLSEILNNPAVAPAEVRAIGVSGQQHGFVPLDREGKVIRPAKLWCDTATADQCGTITDRMGGAESVVSAIGNSIAAGFTASKVLWLAEKEPENYDRLDCLLLPHDYINFWLTGERKTEFGDASGTAYFDVRRRDWSREILDTIDPSGKLKSCLPELVDSAAPVGTVRPELAAKFGLENNVLVSSGGGDNMMGAIGTGNVSPGVITASLGTSGTIYAYSEEPVIDPEGELAAFCSSSGGWLPLVCTMNVTVATELTRNLLETDIQKFNHLADKSVPGATGMVMLPYFNGERTPALPNSTASIHGINSSNFNQQNLCRAAMEGATFGLRYGLDVLRRLGVEPREIRLIGGGAKSVLWQQVVADIFGCPVVRPVISEAGALGAAIQAVWCDSRNRGENLGIAEIAERYVKMDVNSGTMPIPENVSLYNDLYERYLKLDASLRSLNN